ncbi:MAG TPA: 5-oxoprolinase subunit PxpB [Opitutaceae bacterium]|jgi:inhibitor of KinA|nr:5-oxoprolinase subunit PxpB [Opitutaceae bacterium]
MKKPVLTCEPLGDSALTVTIGPPGDPSIPARVRALAAALAKARLPGLLDFAPAYASVTVFYDPARTEGEGALPFHRMQAAVMDCADSARVGHRRVPRRELEDRLVEIPVCYGGEFGPDLPEIAERARLPPRDVIARHSGVEYRVEAIGFVPGFPYLSGLPQRLHAPRRATPRELVPAGSVGIGGAQTGVYPLATPGGWNLIGRTPSTLFRPLDNPPALLRAGDRVVFRPITAEEFAVWK